MENKTYMEICGSVYSGASQEWQKGIMHISRTLKAEKHDTSIVEQYYSGGLK